MEETKNCPKCKGVMEIGWITEVYSPFKRASWVQKVHWFKGNAHHPVDSYKCKNCGFIENYSTREGGNL